MDPLLTPVALREAAYQVNIPTGDAADKALARMIDKAQARMLRAACPGLADRIAADDDLATLATGIVEDMVLRVLRNPNGLRQVSIDDFTKMIDTALSSGAIYLSDAERDLLCPRSRRRGRVGTIRVGLPTWRRW